MKQTKKIHKKKKELGHKAEIGGKPCVDKKLQINQALFSKALKIITDLQNSKEEDKNNLLAIGKNSFIYLTIVVNELPTKIHIKPLPIELKHSIHGPELNTRCFFIVTNKFKQENKELLRNLKHPWKFVSYDQFRKKFHEYKDKLSLLKEYDLFFCDARIYSILKQHCGTHFYRQKKYPCPVNFEGKIDQVSENISEDQMKDVLASLLKTKTFFVQGNGPEYAIKIGRLNVMSEKAVFENCKTGLKQVLSILVQRGIKLGNLRRVAVRGEKTETFPLFSHLTPAEKRIMKKILEEGNN